MTNQNRKSINRTRINKRKSLRNNKKVGGANPTYLYLIYTEAACSEGNFLFHIRYLGFNLKDISYLKTQCNLVIVKNYYNILYICKK